MPDAREINVSMMHVSFSREEVEEMLIRAARDKIETSEGRRATTEMIDDSFAPQIQTLGSNGEQIFFRLKPIGASTLSVLGTMGSVRSKA
jgi:hypothetical protein